MGSTFSIGGRFGGGGGGGRTVGIHSGRSLASTAGMTAGASNGSATSSPIASECVKRDNGTVYHFRLPIDIDGRVTSPNRSRGMGLSLCLNRDARPGQRLTKD